MRRRELLKRALIAPVGLLAVSTGNVSPADAAKEPKPIFKLQPSHPGETR
jgi:hypothetical protein